ncbi:hypothetical protein BOX15_Mlig032333g1, partial [Macrostomum lignano]
QSQSNAQEQRQPAADVELVSIHGAASPKSAPRLAMPPATWLLRLLLSLPLLLSVFVAASTADGSGGSGLRLRARVGRVFIRRPPSPPPPRTEVPSPLPAWLYFNSSLGVVEGVPLAGDVGVHLVPALGATVEVLDGPAAGNATGGCSWRHPTMAAVLVDADPRQLGPAGLCRLLRDLSLRLRVRIASLEVSPDRTAVSGGQAARPPLYMLASGPGSANVRRTAGALVTWQVGCGSIDARHLLALERLERLAMTGDLTGWPVLLWYVADRLDSPAYWRPGDSPAAGIRLRRDIAGNLLLAGRVGAADAEGSGAFLPPQYAGGVGQSGGGGAAGTTASTSSWAGSTIPVRTIELPSAPTTDPASLTSSTAPPTTTTPGLPLRRANQEFGSRQYLFPVDQVTRVPVPRDTVLERATGRGLEALASSVQNCGTLNSLSDFGRYDPAKLQLVGRPTRRHIGVALSCRLVVEDRAGARIFIGFNVRVPEPLPPVPLPQQQTFSFSLGLPFSEVIRPDRFFADASEQNLTVCVSLVPDDCSKDFAVNSSVQFNRTSGSLYGLVWQRDDSVGPIISMEVFVVGISKYGKASSIRAAVEINQNYVKPEWVNHVYTLFVDGPSEYIDRLTSSTALLYSTVSRLNDFFLASVFNSTYRIDSQIHLRRLLRPAGTSRSLQFDFGYTRNYGRLYCPRMSIIELAKAMYLHCPDRPKRPRPEFSAILLPLQPTDLTVTPLDTCTSRPDYSFMRKLYYSSQCNAAPTLPPKPPTDVQTALQPTPHPAPALRVNYATLPPSLGGGRYCLMPFTVYAGQAFYRPLRRPNCVTDASGRKNLTVLHMQLCTQVLAGACLLRSGFIAWNSAALRFEGIPFEDDVGENRFVVLVTDVNSSQYVQVELLVTVASLDHQFRHHQVVTTISADSSLTRRDGSGLHEYFRRLYEMLSAVMSGESIYLQLRARDFMHLRMSQPAMFNLTVTWAYLEANKELSRERQLRLNTSCPVDELMLLRSHIQRHLETVLKSHHILLQGTYELLFGECRRLDWAGIKRRHKLAMRLGPRGRVVEPGRLPDNRGSRGGGGGLVGTSDVALGGSEDSNVILITVLPACGLVILALLVALGVACCLYRRKPASASGRSQQQQQQQQQMQGRQAGRADLSLLSNKRVPIIFAEELEERPSAPGRPLILPHEKPPGPLPADYQLQQQRLLMNSAAGTAVEMLPAAQPVFQQQHLGNGHHSLQRPQQQQHLAQGSATIQQRHFQQNHYAGY